jgi:hypothetical protein
VAVRGWIELRPEAPQPELYANQGFIELGSWQARKLRQRPAIHLYPWMPLPTSNSTPAEQPRVNRDPLALARFYQGLLDSQVVNTRAELARYLNVSRARVTQVLRRLELARKPSSRNGQPEGEGSHAAG